MPWEPTRHRPRDHNVMFAIYYQDGQTAYVTMSPKAVREGMHVVREQIRKRQEDGELRAGTIATIKRVH
jgi:hypothetical protein